jgi:O-antigen/teichoic acid export membrane protein
LILKSGTAPLNFVKGRETKKTKCHEVRSSVADSSATNADTVVTTAKGSLIVLIGNVIQGVLWALSSIVVARLLSPEGYGLYVLALIPSLFLSYFFKGGISNAATKYIVSLRVRGRLEEINQIITSAFILITALGLTLTAFLVLSSNFFAAVFLDRPYATELVAYSCFLLIGMALMQLAGGVFLGLEKMRLYSALLVLQSASMLGLSVFLIAGLSLGVSGAVLGNVVSYLGTGVCGLLIISKSGYLSKKALNVAHGPLSNILGTYKLLLSFGVPVFLSNILIGAIPLYQGFVLSRFADNVEIGSYGAAFNFIKFLNTLTLTITTSLLPAFSKLDANREARHAFSLSLKYSSLLMAPVVLFVMATSSKIIGIMYGKAYAQAGPFLFLYIAVFILTGLGYVILSGFFMGLGAPRITLYLSSITFATIIPLGWTLTAMYGVYGLIVATLICNLAGTLYGLIVSWKRFGARIPPAVPKIFFASLVSAIPLFVLNTLDPNPLHNYIANLAVYGFLFLLIYLTTLPLIGGLNANDIRLLGDAMKDFQFIRPFIRMIVIVESKLMGLTHS